jgi:hypothetical protein
MSFGSSKIFHVGKKTLRDKVTLHELHSYEGLLNSNPILLRLCVTFSCPLVKVTPGFL